MYKNQIHCLNCSHFLGFEITYLKLKMLEAKFGTYDISVFWQLRKYLLTALEGGHNTTQTVLTHFDAQVSKLT